LSFCLPERQTRASRASILDEQLDAWRAERHVQFLSHPNDMSALLQTMDILVLPTKYAERVLRVLLEGAAASRL
jgi:glycosyltransferase involved in cell wall biosynthesis